MEGEKQIKTKGIFRNPIFKVNFSKILNSEPRSGRRTMNFFPLFEYDFNLQNIEFPF